jgi:hypothetical protein
MTANDLLTDVIVILYVGANLFPLLPILLVLLLIIVTSD